MNDKTEAQNVHLAGRHTSNEWKSQDEIITFSPQWFSHLSMWQDVQEASRKQIAAAYLKVSDSTDLR